MKVTLTCRWLVLAVVALTALACGDSKKTSFDLLPARPTNEDAEAERLRKMQLVTVINVDKDPPETTTMAPEAFASLVGENCGSSTENCGSDSGCNVFCAGRTELCNAKTYLALTRPQGTTIKLKHALIRNGQPAAENFVVPLQAEAANVALAQEGLLSAINAGFFFNIGLQAVVNPEVHSSCFQMTGPFKFEGLTIAEHLTNGFADTFNTYNQLTDAAVASAVNTADAELNSAPSIALASQRATTQRLIAAKQLGGTATALPLANNGAFCTRPEATPAVRAAVAILRDAATSPEDILSGRTTQALLDGPDGFGSVRDRLAEFYGDKALRQAGIGGVEHKFNLDLATFEEARAVMKEEIVAFSRSQFSLLPPRPSLLIRDNTFQRFAATATPPGRVPAAYYGALARQGGGTAADSLDGSLDLNTGYAENYLAFISAASSFVAQGDVLPSAIRNIALGPLALMLANKELIANVYTVPTPVNSSITHYQMYVSGLSPSDGIMLAFGEDQLRCAVQGSIEGGAENEGGKCSLSFVAVNTFQIADDVQPGSAFKVVSKLKSEFSVPKTSHRRYYLLKPRVPPADPANPYAGTPIRGGYEALGGITLTSGLSQGEQAGGGFVVIAGNEEHIAGILEPSPKWCAHPRLQCDDTTFDARIALENELTDDSNGFENSWKHYLDLAKSAAAEADLLGTDYINTSLQSAQHLEDNENRKEQQLEAANAQLEQLQTLCGFNMDTHSLLTLLSDGDGNIMKATNGDCNPDDSCPQGYTCTLHNICTLDIDAFLKVHDSDPDIRRIEDCLSAGKVEPFMSLGDLPLCLWTDPTNPNIVCQGANGVAVPSGHCPEILPRAQAETGRLSDPDAEKTRLINACNALFTSDARLTNVRPTNASTQIAKPLGYFAITGAADDKPTQDLYKKLRRIDRSSWSELRYSDGVRAKNLLDPNRLVETINGLDWESRFDDYGAIKFLGTSMYETGVGTKDPTPSKIPNPMDPSGPQVDAPWPCGIGHDETDLTDKRPWLGASSRPASYDCSFGRVAANQEMFAAVAAAKLLGPIVDDQLYDFDGHGFPLISFGSLQQDEVARPMIIVENHWWLADMIADPAGIAGRFNRVDVIAPVYECGTFAFEGVASKKSCDSSKSLLRPHASAVLQSSCETGTAYTAVNGAENRYGDKFANLGCFHPGRLHASSHRITDGALRGLSNTFPSFAFGTSERTDDSAEGGIDSWIIGYLNGHTSLSEVVATYTWDSQNVRVPGVLHPSDGSGPRKLDLTGEDLLMGLSLITRALSLPPAVSFEHPPEVRTVDDLEGVSLYVQALSDKISNGVSSIAFADVPTRVADALRMESANGSTPQFGGDMAVQISAARGALLKIHQNGPLIANEVKQLGVDIRELKLILRKAGINQDIADLQFASQLANQLTNCAVAATHVSIDPVAAGGAAAAAAITCANSIAQIGFASDLTALAKQNTVLDGELAIADFGGKFSAHSTAMQGLASLLAEGEEELDAALATIESKRHLARSTLINALSAASFQAEHQAEVTNVLANLSNGKQLRYKVALKNAKNLAFVAKRAIEQRLGVHLANITEDYPLVEAPSKWESTVCTLTGVNYAKLTEANPNAPQSFAGGFIGDYVTKLENFVESYTLQQNFHEGTDTAVISLRDDIMNVRKNCAVKAPNLLFDAGQLEQSQGWAHESCPTQDVGEGVTQPVSDCVNVTPSTDAPTFSDPNAAHTVGYSLEFGSAATTDSALVQSVSLPGGRFRFSWYTKETGTIPDPGDAGGPHMDPAPPWHGGADAGTIRSDSALDVVKDAIVPATTDGWNRRYKIFRLASPATVRVGFAKPTDSATATVSAPMLEQIADVNTDQALVPFVNTIQGVTEVLPACEDSDGKVFQSTRWNRSCVKLCADGFADNCTTGNSQEYCYWEAEFGFSQRDIQLGKVFNFSGFARGNFNYRIDSVGINFVGTGTRDCSTSAFPQTCFGNGSIPYSLIHTGPFFVRNFRGDDIATRIFDGSIEHARGLATERYLTNPLSDTDNSLIKQYLRGEFSGRPLDGNFVLRIWDENGVDFKALQDVQVVLNYRYWTKFN